MTTRLVFTHPGLLDGLGKNHNINTFDEAEQTLVRREAKRSNVVFATLQFIIAQVTSKGYTIEYSEAGQTRKVSEEFVNTILNSKWNPELPKAIIQTAIDGGYAIRYTKTGNKEDDFIYPRVMDDSEYYIGWKTKRDGSRAYFAYEKANHQKPKIIPQSRVFMMYEPTADGHLTSPVSRCLEELKLWHFYWDLDQTVAYRNAFPAFFYLSKEIEDGLLPNTTQAGALAEYEKEIQSAPTVSFDQLQAIQAHDKTIQHMRQMLERETSRTTVQQHFGSIKQVNPDTNTYYEVANQYPFAPYQQVPPGLTVAEAPRAQEAVNMQYALDKTLQLITASLGVPSDILFDTGKKFSTDLRISQRTVNETVRKWQNSLEAHIVTMYLDVYYKKYAERVDRALDGVVEDRKRKFLQTQTPSEREQPYRLIDPDERVRIERTMTVTVTFNNNPIVSLHDVQKLYDDNIINKDTYNRHMLEIVGYSVSEALTAAEELSQIKEKAEKAKLATPEPKNIAKRQKPNKEDSKPTTEKAVEKQLKTSQV